MEQLSIFLENRSGSLAEVMQALVEAGIFPRASVVTDTSSFGVLRVIVDDPEKAVEVLKDLGFSCRVSEVSVVEAEGVREMLATLKTLGKKEVNVEYLYAFTDPATGRVWMVFRADDMQALNGLLEEERKETPC